MGKALHSAGEGSDSNARRYVFLLQPVSHYLQMRRHWKPSPTEISTTDHVQCAPVSTPALTRFIIQDSVYNAKPTRDKPTPEAEFKKYISSPLSSDKTDILQFWEVSVPITVWPLWHYHASDNAGVSIEQANSSEFPTLFTIAMDYLPIQATSVPCERVFSSAKDTDTAKRNRIDPRLLEMLQMLKFSLKKDRLNFMHGWETSEGDLEILERPGVALSTLFVPDSDCALDTLLESCSVYDT